MKKIIILAALIIVLAMGLVSCGWDIEIRNPNEPEENISQLLPSKNDESKTEEKADKENMESVLSAEYVFLSNFDERTSYDFIEFKDKIVVYSVSGEISAFDIVTGEKIYEFFLGNINENAAFDFRKTDEKEGFDYRVLWKDRIIYLSSENPEIIETVFLPTNVMETMDGYASYSLYGDRIIWQAEDGIRMMDMKTGEESLVLDNAVIDEKVRPIAEIAIEGMWIGDNGVECAFETPRFICGGTKIVAIAVSRDMVYWMVTIYDIESGEFEWAYSYNEMTNADYPFADKYVVVAGEKWINAETGNYKNFEDGNYSLYSFDGIEFVKVSWHDMEGRGMEVFAGNFENIENGGEKIAEISREEVQGHIVAVTENYIVIRVFEDEITDHYIVRYR